MLLYFFLPIILIFMYFLYPYYFGLPYFETDFVDYCIGIEIFTDENRYFPPKRSKLAGLFPWLFSHFGGIFQGLNFGALFSVLGISFFLIEWAKQSSKQAGWLMGGLLLSCSPLIGLTRFLNFYPEIIFFLCLAGFLVSRALWKPSWQNFALAGIGIGLCILSDARGLIWGGYYALLLFGFIIFNRKTRNNWLLNLSTLILPIWLSWFGAWWAFHQHSSSLIRQMDTRPLLGQAPAQYPSEFVWGYGAAQDISANILFLLQNPSASLQSSPSEYWYFWFFVSLISGNILVFMKKDHWKLLAPLIPFFLAFWSIGSMVEPHVRFYAQSLPPLLISIAILLSLCLKSWKTILPAIIILPWLSLWLPQSWAIEREISTKMLKQAFPENETYSKQTVTFGDPVHIQTLPLRSIERKIAHDWDQVCTQALIEDGTWNWYD